MKKLPLHILLVPLFLFIANLTYSRVKTKVYFSDLPTKIIEDAVALEEIIQISAPVIFDKLLSTETLDDLNTREYADKFAIPISVDIDIIEREKK